ncbi:hypothetical protein ACFL5K_04800 [Gemmatimonadota bacterium]
MNRTVLVTALLVCLFVDPARAQYKEDFNGDGNVNVIDVIALLITGKTNPDDPLADYNGDGGFSVSDAISMLLNILSGKLNPLDSGAGNWRVLGPGGGGSMFLPTVNPHDPDNVLVRCDMTGAYVTFNNAESWRMFNLRTVVKDFEFDYLAPGTVYAVNAALYRSTDNGRHWSLIYPEPGNITAERMVGDHAEQSFVTADGMPDGQMSKIRVDPQDSDHIWLTISNPGPENKILVSHDRGSSWDWINAEFYGNVLAIFPGSWWEKPGELIAITDRSCLLITEDTGEIVELARPSQTPFIEVDGGKGEQGVVLYILAGSEYTTHRVFTSVDLSSSWQRSEDIIFSGTQFSALATCEGQPEVAYLSCGYYYDTGGQRLFGVLKTEDTGVTWSWVYQASADQVLSGNFDEGWMDREYGPIWREYAWSLGVAPSDPDICYAADWGATIRTLDGGANWEQVYTQMQPDGSAASRGLDVTTCYGVHFDPFDQDHLFISYTDIGLFHSLNGGESWFHTVDGIPSNWVNTCYWLEFDPEIEGRIWSVWGNAHDLPRHKMFRNGFTGKYGGVALSNDNGESWQTSNSGLPANTVCTHIVVDPRSSSASRTLYLCGFKQGVYKSTNGGASWIPTAAVPGINNNYWRLALLPDGKLFLLVVRDRLDYVTTPGGLFVSGNGGGSWQQVTLPQGVEFPNDLVYDPSDPERMYLSCWPVYPQDGAYGGGGLLITEDGGQSWRQVFRENAHVYAAAVDPDNTSTLYINTFDSAAFRSLDRGETWTRLKGYTFKWGHRPVIDPRNPEMLYLTTFGGSVYYGPAAGVPGAAEDILNFQDEWRWGE